MGAFIDLTNKEFGRLVVVSRAENRGTTTMWNCKCKCGNNCVVSATSLRSGATKSCGCLHRELVSARSSFDLVGKTFGRLTVVQKVGTDKHGNLLWKCICSCDDHGTVITTSAHLMSGHTQSCGCYKRDRSSEAHLKYDNPTDEYLAVHLFGGMKQRCYNPNDTRFTTYGGRGIRICDEWLRNPQLFADWAKSNGYRKGLSIERIDNNGPYSPDNCRFIQLEEQSTNRTTARLITVCGITQSVSQWAHAMKIDPGKLYYKTDKQISDMVSEYIKSNS